MEIKITVWGFENINNNNNDDTIAAVATATTTTTLYLKKAGQLTTESKYSSQI